MTWKYPGGCLDEQVNTEGKKETPSRIPLEQHPLLYLFVLEATSSDSFRNTTKKILEKCFHDIPYGSRVGIFIFLRDRVAILDLRPAMPQVHFFSMETLEAEPKFIFSLLAPSEWFPSIQTCHSTILDSEKVLDATLQSVFGTQDWCSKAKEKAGSMTELAIVGGVLKAFEHEVMATRLLYFIDKKLLEPPYGPSFATYKSVGSGLAKQDVCVNILLSYSVAEAGNLHYLNPLVSATSGSVWRESEISGLGNRNAPVVLENICRSFITVTAMNCTLRVRTSKSFEIDHEGVYGKMYGDPQIPNLYQMPFCGPDQAFAFDMKFCGAKGLAADTLPPTVQVAMAYTTLEKLEESKKDEGARWVFVRYLRLMSRQACVAKTSASMQASLNRDVVCSVLLHKALKHVKISDHLAGAHLLENWLVNFGTSLRNVHEKQMQDGSWETLEVGKSKDQSHI